MSRRDSAPLVVNGWILYAPPLFLSQLEALTEKAEALRARDPAGYKRKNVTKRLAAIRKLAFEVIPADPARPEYRQGKTLGKDYKHWFRAKFLQQYRLFFRFHSSSRLIVYAWVNDESSLRAYDSAEDAYRVFRQMLDGGNPPDDWDSLLKAAQFMRSDRAAL
ncbi:type II toxin-antitoxin system YhaV family toxin [Wenzhouxiangella sp. EGI_FJ10409]|uniref:type II toxin-antitoxin system YhaV family toxin n=1 Tax=Wenzhouxiangella sp. EGI_FJ10409 TaxID=3243767 RepID=UPI0035D5B550